MRSDHLLWWPALDGLDLEILRTALSSGIISEPLLWAKGSYRYPLEDGTDDSKANQIPILEAVAVCRDLGVTPILIRSLWPDLPGQEPNDHMFDEKFYRDRFTLAAREADLLGIKWAFEIEPYKPQHDQPTSVWTLIRERHSIHETVGPPMVAALERGAGALDQPSYVLPGCTHVAGSLYSQIGQSFAAERRIAIPPSYDHERSDRVTIKHAAMQWIFAAKGEVGRFNYASVADLAATDRRILIYAGDSRLAALADDLAKCESAVPATLSHRITGLERRIEAVEKAASS